MFTSYMSSLPANQATDDFPRYLSVRFNATDSNNAITGSFKYTNDFSRDCSLYHDITVGQSFGLARAVRKGSVLYTRLISITLLQSLLLMRFLILCFTFFVLRFVSTIVVVVVVVMTNRLHWVPLDPSFVHANQHRHPRPLPLSLWQRQHPICVVSRRLK